MANGILKAAAQGISEGINKSPLPNPIGTVAGGIGGIKSGLSGYKKNQLAKAKKFQKKQTNIANKIGKVQDKVNKKMGNPKNIGKVLGPAPSNSPHLGKANINVDKAVKQYKKQQNKKGPLLVQNDFESALKKKMGL